MSDFSFFSPKSQVYLCDFFWLVKLSKLELSSNLTMDRTIPSELRKCIPHITDLQVNDDVVAPVNSWDIIDSRGAIIAHSLAVGAE